MKVLAGNVFDVVLREVWLQGKKRVYFMTGSKHIKAPKAKAMRVEGGVIHHMQHASLQTLPIALPDVSPCY